MLITENSLDEWVRAHAESAQGLIVELVWRLVAASSSSPKERRFPLGDSIGQPGPDGILDTDFNFEPFVPDGLSFWEIGTGIKPAAKATSDYSDLTDFATTAKPLEVRLQSSFVFVSPLSGRRGWKQPAQQKWLDTRRKRNQWKNIRVIDGTKLVDWMHHFPSVELWLAANMGLPTQQIETPEQHWEVLKSIGDPPPLTPHIFLVNREKACAKLNEVFAGNVNRLKLDTRYPEQVADFVCAFIASIEEERRIDIAGRCLVISGIEAWNHICSQPVRHILVADHDLDLTGATGTKLLEKAHRAGHAVVYGGLPGGIPDPNREEIPNPKSYQIKDVLEKAGYPEERSRILAQKSGGNLSSLLRCLHNLSIMPEWAEGTAAAELAIAVMLGSWDENSDADRAVVETLSGKSYGEWIGKVREIALLPSTPLIQRDGAWKFVARYEGWYALGPRLFDEHLDRLQVAAKTVLTEKDPQFDLPSEERYATSFYGKELAHSSLLRNGIAESLALLGSHSSALSSCKLGKAEVTAILAVREIFTDSDWQRWASLSEIIPMLAEAAPGEFLDAFERVISKVPCPFDKVFSQEDDGFMGRTYMSGVIWALETLAWDSNLLSRVTICLGELASRDPGGRWSNRPINSLTTIFLPWLPQTCAPIAIRSSAVSTLLAELPEVGWKLLVSLLPNTHSSSFGTRRPAWRETIPDDWPKDVSRREYWEQTEIYSEMAVTAAKGNIKKFTELIDHIENLPAPVVEQILAHLSAEAVTTLPEADRLCIWTELIDLVTKHRKFSDAGWAMKAEQIDEISAVAERLSPISPVIRHQRLFSERDFDLYEEKDNFEDQRIELETRRQQAVREVAAEGGTQAVCAFAAAVQSPWRVGMAFGEVAEKNVDEEVLPELFESEQRQLTQFSGGFVRSRFNVYGWEWVDNINILLWTSTQIGQFLSFLPFTSGTWERANQFLDGDEVSYWSKTTANPYESEESNLEIAVKKLLEYERPIAALRCLYKMRFNRQSLNTVQVVRVLLAALNTSESLHSLDTFETVEIIKALQTAPDASDDDIFQVEWAYLPLLVRNRDASPKLLEQRLASDPDFFCEVIRIIFQSKKENRTTEEITEERKRIASNAYRLLIEWSTPPGSQADGTFDGNSLCSWLKTVKERCLETGHYESAMTMLGHSLIHVPSDPDGLWIHRSAAEALNVKDADDLRDGFVSELFNSRGVYGFTAGREELELAAKYRSQADAVDAAGFHRVATTLRKLAASYERDAEREAVRDPFDS